MSISWLHHLLRPIIHASLLLRQPCFFSLSVCSLSFCSFFIILSSLFRSRLFFLRFHFVLLRSRFFWLRSSAAFRTCAPASWAFLSRARAFARLILALSLALAFFEGGFWWCGDRAVASWEVGTWSEAGRRRRASCCGGGKDEVFTDGDEAAGDVVGRWAFVV